MRAAVSFKGNPVLALLTDKIKQERCVIMQVDKTGYMVREISSEALLSALAEGKVGGMGYDGENIVSLACDCGPACLDEVLTRLEALGEDPDVYAHLGDFEGFSAVQLHRSNERICEVFRKHHVSLEWKRLSPLPWSDVYELYTERTMIERMEATARKWHEGQFRKDGVTPYCVHPEKVANRLSSWGFKPEHEGWAVAVAWAHDLLEETPPAQRENVEAEIESSANGLLREGKHVLEAVKLLSRDKTVFPVKADYIRHVARQADFPTLAVKIADRLCNTADFLSLEGAGIEKAKRYLAAGEPLFEALEKFNDVRKKNILADIAELKAQLAN